MDDNIRKLSDDELDQVSGGVSGNGDNDDYCDWSPDNTHNWDETGKCTYCGLRLY